MFVSLSKYVFHRLKSLPSAPSFSLQAFLAHLAWLLVLCLSPPGPLVGLCLSFLLCGESP